MLPSFWVSKLLWNFNILEKMMSVSMIILINYFCNAVTMTFLFGVNIDLMVMEIQGTFSE